MKTNKENTNGKHNGLQPVDVHFELTDPKAVSVFVAGSFNGWKPEANDLSRSAKGHWQAEIPLTPGSYEYCLVVDGQWIPDPRARETVPNPYGGRNSLLTVATSPEAAHRAEGMNLPLK